MRTTNGLRTVNKFTYIHTKPLLKCLIILVPIVTIGTNWGTFKTKLHH